MNLASLESIFCQHRLLPPACSPIPPTGAAQCQPPCESQAYPPFPLWHRHPSRFRHSANYPNRLAIGKRLWRRRLLGRSHGGWRHNQLEGIDYGEVVSPSTPASRRRPQGQVKRECALDGDLEWDTAGQERFRTITSSYYLRGSWYYHCL